MNQNTINLIVASDKQHHTASLTLENHYTQFKDCSFVDTTSARKSQQTFFITLGGSRKGIYDPNTYPVHVKQIVGKKEAMGIRKALIGKE